MGYSLKPPPRSGRPDPVPLPPPPQGVAFIPRDAYPHAVEEDTPERWDEEPRQVSERLVYYLDGPLAGTVEEESPVEFIVTYRWWREHSPTGCAYRVVKKEQLIAVARPLKQWQYFKVAILAIDESKTEPTDDDKRIIRDWIDPQGVIRTGTMQSSVSRGLAIPQGPRPITVRE